MADGLRLAKVVRTHPNGNSVDLLFFDDGSRASNVMCMSSSGASANSGFVDLPDTGKDDGEDAWTWEDDEKGMTAVVGFVRGQPLVMGFLYPQVNQMAFNEKNRMIYRHSSNAYVTIDKDGNLDAVHPSGSFIRIGEKTTEKKMGSADYDKKWSVKQAKPASIHIEVIAGDDVLAQVTMKDTGEVLIDTRKGLNMVSDTFVKVLAEGDVNVEAKGNATVKAGGDVLSEAGGNAQFVADGAVLVKSKSDRVTLESAGGSLVI